ncbi:MAG: DNA translocase FtsK 4TM domain-containing protein, partial [bacterium]|nr:DNA translocase FtsK 4TM domain-containing protein [bacterium]
MARKKKKKNGDRKKQALGILCFLLALLILVSLISHNSLDDSRLAGDVDNHLNPFKIKYNNQAGMAGVVIAFYLLKTIGWLAFFIPLGLIFLSLRLFASELANRFEVNSLVLFGTCLIGTMIYNVHILAERSLDIVTPTAGGIVADRLTFVSIKLVGELGSYILMGGLILILGVLFTSFRPAAVSFNFSLPGKSVLFGVGSAIGNGFKRFFSFNWLPSLFESTPEEDDEAEYEDAIEEHDTIPESVAAEKTDGLFDTDEDEFEGHDIEDEPEPRLTKTKSGRKLKAVKPAEQLQLESVMYKYPSIESLSENPIDQPQVDEGELSMTARMLAETLQTFGVRIDGEISTFPGPVITRFEFKPASGVKVNQILNLSDDLALALKAKRIRIIAPIPGKAAVGVEIPNRSPQMVV